MAGTADIPELQTDRLRLTRFDPGDAAALAEILMEPDVTKTITADGSSPERCLASARKRIGWHNASWDTLGYGVWAARAANAGPAPEGSHVGWCGFAAPDIGDDPEILYGYAPAVWGHGLAIEAARAAIGWLFENTRAGGVSAVIFHRLNPASVRIVRNLGLTLRGTMAVADFYSSSALAAEVLQYEIWRLGQGHSRDLKAMLFEAPYRTGQLATLGFGDASDTLDALIEAARHRVDFDALDTATLIQRITDAFCAGINEPFLEWYHLPRPT